MLKEDEGRKMMKPLHLQKLHMVHTEISNRINHAKIDEPVIAIKTLCSNRDYVWSLIQKVRYKKYVLTKQDMELINDIFICLRSEVRA